MKKRDMLTAASVLVLSFCMVLAGCSGSGVGGSFGGGSGATVISGKVALSSSLSLKATMNASSAAQKIMASKTSMALKPQSPSMSMQKLLTAVGVNAALVSLPSATVELYDADKPEWLYPIAVDVADSSGNYTLQTLVNMENNPNPDGSAPYQNGDSIPAGNYTVIATKISTDALGAPVLLVAVQAIVKNFSGEVIGNDLTAQDSDAVPGVATMLGLSANDDGSFGSATTPLARNAAVQITFSAAMSRLSVMQASTITDSAGIGVSGKWKMSPDLVTATFYPFSSLAPNQVYTVKIGGGKAQTTAQNVYGKPIPSTVKGYFKASLMDVTPPTAIRKRPTSKEKSNMSITNPLRIAADEPLDINTIRLDSDPSIGDRPSIKYIGISEAPEDASYPYMYELIPSGALALGKTYSLTVRGGKDMAGLTMDVLNFSFTVEATTSGVSGAPGSAEEAAQLGVKNVLGKWINAMNARNTTLLTSYMSGDFFWINDTSKGMSRDDLNRDGRMSLNEFTTMLTNWFDNLEYCGSTITEEIVGDIVVNGSTATVAFNLNMTNANTTDRTCSDSGPKNTLYASMELINSAWLLTRGSDMVIAQFPQPLKVIELTSPANGAQFAEPSAASPVNPDFTWNEPQLAAGDLPVATYLVILIDTKSPWQETGWAALVKPSALFSPSVKFNPTPGDYGDVIVLGFGNSSGGNSLGFRNSINEILAGGNYSWAVLGFHTKSLEDFKLMNFDPSDYLFASSKSLNFSVAGVYKELALTVSNGSTVYTYLDNSNGYSVGSSATVDLVVTTPNTGATTCNLSLYGYTSKNIQAPFINSAATFTGVELSDNNNSVSVSDGMGLWKNFQIYTTGGAQPMITYTVNAYNCSANPANLAGPDSWSNYTSTDACTVDIFATVNGSTSISQLSVNVGNDNDNGKYSKSLSVTPGVGVNILNVPVYNGRNWISLYGYDSSSQKSHNNYFGIETAAGSVYVPPITATVVGSAPTSSSMSIAYYNVVSAGTATIDVVMPNIAVSGGGWSQSVDPNWSFITNSTISSSSDSFTVTLYTGWNYISLYDNSGNNYYLFIYTTGGTKFTPPNVINFVGGKALDSSGTVTTTSCSVLVQGAVNPAKFTGTPGLIVYLNSYNPATSASVWESSTSVPDGAGNYSFPHTVYPGYNRLDVYAVGADVSDPTINVTYWAGAQITSNAGSSCAPTVFDVTSIKNDSNTVLTPDAYGDYNAGSSATSATISGTVKAGRTITAYISGMYYSTISTTATGTTSFSINVPVYGGYNYVSISDGYNWLYRNIYTNGPGATWTPPMHGVTATGGNYMSRSSGGGTSDNWASYNTDAASVTISGLTSGADGWGYYYQWGGYNTSGTMLISNGTFTLNIPTIDYGYNYFDLYDANGNYFYLTIYTTGGASAPTKYISITSPSQGDPVSGNIGVTGTVNAGFTPQNVYAYVYDAVNSTSTWFSSNSADLLSGYQPLSVDMAGNISFSAAVISGNTTMIEVYGYDGNGSGHGAYIYVNNAYGYSPYYWKPGSVMTKSDASARAHREEFQKHIRRK